jgi:hypothetical protein
MKTMDEGFTVSANKSAGPTVSGSGLLVWGVPASVIEAWMVVGPPTVKPKAVPLELIGATELNVELQVAMGVTSTCVPPTVAVAVYCSFNPLAIEGSGEAIDSAVNVPDGMTTTGTLALKGPLTAVMKVVPVLAVAVTLPVLSTAATAGLEEYHFAGTETGRLGAC